MQSPCSSYQVHFSLLKSREIHLVSELNCGSEIFFKSHVFRFHIKKLKGAKPQMWLGTSAILWFKSCFDGVLVLFFLAHYSFSVEQSQERGDLPADYGA